MKDVQCYELFGGIALKNHAFSFSRLEEFIATLLMFLLHIIFSSFFLFLIHATTIQSHVSLKSYTEEKVFFQ